MYEQFMGPLNTPIQTPDTAMYKVLQQNQGQMCKVCCTNIDSSKWRDAEYDGCIIDCGCDCLILQCDSKVIVLPLKSIDFVEFNQTCPRTFY